MFALIQGRQLTTPYRALQNTISDTVKSFTTHFFNNKQLLLWWIFRDFQKTQINGFAIFMQESRKYWDLVNVTINISFRYVFDVNFGHLSSIA
jgi:hypothetical protein